MRNPLHSRGMVARLESRRLLASVTLGGDGTLNIVGDGADDFIQLAVNGSNLTVFANGTSSNTALSSIQRINISLADGNDTFTVTGSALTVPMTVAGGNGNDTISYAAGAATLPVLDAGAGFDQLTLTRAGAFNYTIPLGLEKVTVTGNVVGLTITGNDERNEVLITSAGSINVNTLGGDDYVTAASASGSAYAILDGGTGRDVLVGTKNADSLRGGDGNDSIYAGGGEDKVWGGAGDDFLAGEGGKDLLRGEDGNDRLYGGALSDKLYGGSGADRLHGQDGNDTLYGEGGGDFFVGDAGTDSADKKSTDRSFFSIEVYF